MDIKFIKKERKHILLRLLHFSVQSNDQTVNSRQSSLRKRFGPKTTNGYKEIIEFVRI